MNDDKNILWDDIKFYYIGSLPPSLSSYECFVNRGKNAGRNMDVGRVCGRFENLLAVYKVWTVVQLMQDWRDPVIMPTRNNFTYWENRKAFFGNIPVRCCEVIPCQRYYWVSVRKGVTHWICSFWIFIKFLSN